DRTLPQSRRHSAPRWPPLPAPAPCRGCEPPALGPRARCDRHRRANRHRAWRRRLWRFADLHQPRGDRASDHEKLFRSSDCGVRTENIELKDIDKCELIEKAELTANGELTENFERTEKLERTKLASHLVRRSHSVRTYRCT